MNKTYERLHRRVDPLHIPGITRVGVDPEVPSWEVPGLSWNKKAEYWVVAQPVGTLFTADDLISAIGLPGSIVPSGRNNVVGSIFASAGSAGAISPTGQYSRSIRATNKGRRILVWKRRNG